MCVCMCVHSARDARIDFNLGIASLGLKESKRERDREREKERHPNEHLALN